MSDHPLSQYVDGVVVKGTRKSVPLNSQTTSIEIISGLAVVTTERTFSNDSDKSVEFVLTFPVPYQATMTNLVAKIDDRVLKGICQKKQQAQQTYERAVDDGKLAVLHQEALPGIHILSIAHVAPKSKITVASTHVSTLSHMNGDWTLRVPLNCGDVYGQNPLSERDRLTHHTDALNKGTLNLKLETGSSATLHGSAITADNEVEITLDTPIDLVIKNPQLRDLYGTSANGKIIKLAFAPVKHPTAPLNVSILTDRSGSMGELSGIGKKTKHDVMLDALVKIGQELEESDKWRLWGFGSYCRLEESGAGSELVKAANAMVNWNQGTEIGRALDAVIEKDSTRDCVLITDGKSYHIDVQKYANSGKRISVVLIGHDSLCAYVAGIASVTGGQIYVADGADAFHAITSALNSVRTPHIKNELVPYNSKQELTIDNILLNVSKTSNVYSGMQVDVNWNPGHHDIDEHAREVGAVAARMLLPQLKEEQAAEWAVAHNIVTTYSSLVLVDEQAAKQEGLPDQVKVDLATPKNHATTAFVNSGAAWASPAGLHRGVMLCASGGTGVPVFASRGILPSGGRMMKGGGPALRSMGPSYSKGIGGQSLGDYESAGPLYDSAPVFASAAACGSVEEKTELTKDEVIALAKGIEWGNNANNLIAGDISKLDCVQREYIEILCKLSQVIALAQELSKPVVLIVISLLALENGGVTAARVARKILGAIDSSKLCKLY